MVCCGVVVLPWRIAGEVRYVVAKTEPDSTENSFNKDESVANCDGAKLLHRDEAVPVSHLDCAAVSLFFQILSFFVPFFGLLSFFSFFLYFFDLPHHGTGKGNREAGGVTVAVTARVR
jgi:hypothetical protein